MVSQDNYLDYPFVLLYPHPVLNQSSMQTYRYYREVYLNTLEAKGRLTEDEFRNYEKWSSLAIEAYKLYESILDLRNSLYYSVECLDETSETYAQWVRVERLRYKVVMRWLRRKGRLEELDNGNTDQ